jgi:hypothetical protein
MAMAAMIKMIATTISNSIREKPFCLIAMLAFQTIQLITRIVLRQAEGQQILMHIAKGKSPLPIDSTQVTDEVLMEKSRMPLKMRSD